VDAGGEELLRCQKYELSSKIEVNQKGTTFYFEKRKNVQSGTKQ
jgi:hypothetical protein